MKADGGQLFQADSEPHNLKLNSENLKLFCGGRGIRTPDIQLAKLALYQLSYTPALRPYPKPKPGVGQPGPVAEIYNEMTTTC